MNDDGTWGAGKLLAFWGGIIAILLFITIMLLLLLPGYSRYQNRADNNQKRHQALLFAQNRVQVSNIEIRNQAQRVRIAHQQADIRVQEAIGLKRAQDEIRKTLTPLYVQFELVRALQQIATSGQNDTVVYLPTNPTTGLPVVPISNAIRK
jgi:hypothetical protein